MGTGKDGRVLKEDVLAYVSKTLGGEMDMLWGCLTCLWCQVYIFFFEWQSNVRSYCI